MPDQIWFANHLLPTVSPFTSPAHTYTCRFYFWWACSFFPWQQFLSAWRLHASTWPCAWRIRQQLFPHRDDFASLHKSISNSHNMVSRLLKIVSVAKCQFVWSVTKRWEDCGRIKPDINPVKAKTQDVTGKSHSRVYTESCALSVSVLHVWIWSLHLPFTVGGGRWFLRCS